MKVPTIQHTAAHMGGEVHNGRQALVPGPGHSTVDRSLSITINDAGDDVLVNSFAGDDPLVCKDYVREKLRMDEWQPKGRNNGNGNGHAAIDAMIARAAKPSIPPPIDFSAPQPTPPENY